MLSDVNMNPALQFVNDNRTEMLSQKETDRRWYVTQPVPEYIILTVGRLVIALTRK